MNFSISLVILVVTVSLSLLPVHANVDKNESFWTNAIFSGHKWLDSSNCDGQTDSEMERALSSIVTRAKATPGFAHFAYPIINSFLESHREKLASGNADALVDVWAKYKAAHATLWNLARHDLKSEDKNFLGPELDTAVLTALAVASENPGNVQREQAFLHRQLVCTHHSVPGKEANQLNFQAFKTYARAMPLLKETFFATLLFSAPGGDLLDLIREDLTTSKEPFVDEPTLRSWLGAKKRGELKGPEFATALLGFLWKTPLVDSILVNAIETAEKEIVQSILDFCGDCSSEAVLTAADTDTSSDCELRKHLAEVGIKRLSRPNKLSQLNQPASAAIRTPKGSGSKGLELTPSLNADSENEYRALIDIAEAAGRNTESSSDQKHGHLGVDWTKIAQRIVDIRPGLRSKALRHLQEKYRKEPPDNQLAVLEFLLNLKPEVSTKELEPFTSTSSVESKIDRTPSAAAVNRESASIDYVAFPTEYESAWKPFIAPLENSRAMLIGLGKKMGQEGLDLLRAVQGRPKSVSELAHSVKDAVYHGRHRSYDLDPLLEMMQFILIKSLEHEPNLKRELLDFYFDPVLKRAKQKRASIGKDTSSTPQYVYPEAPIRIAIIGGGPAGLATAITLAEQSHGSSVQITVYDKRWVRLGETIRHNPKGKRREQVVTIQNEVGKLLSEDTQKSLFKDKFEEVWRDSKNITIKEVEDRLLARAQHLSFSKIINLVPDGVDLDDFERSTDFHVVIGADGNDSGVKKKFFNGSAPIQPRAVSHALGINFKPDSMASMPPRPQAMNVFLTLAQTRFLLNSSGQEGAGYLNMQLTKDEWEQIKLRNGKDCRFGSPGYIPLNGILPPGVSEGEIFRPYDSKGPLWQSILEGLKLFGFQEENIASIAGIPIMVNGTDTGVKIIHHTKRPHALAFLVGDAAFSVHFWPGRGLNSALKEAVGSATFLARAINSGSIAGLKEETFANYQDFLEKLQHREHELRSFRVLDQSGNPGILADKLSNSGQIKQAKEQFKEKVLGIANRLQEQKGWPHEAHQQLEDYISGSVLNNLEEKTLQQLVATGPWPAMGGAEVFPFAHELPSSEGSLDPSKSQVDLTQIAAAQGNAQAQSTLGWMYLFGKNVVQSDVQAVEWFRKAAQQGIASAQHNLGFMYTYGRGLNQDYVQAAKWFRKAAELGFAAAQDTLGMLFKTGQGVDQDDVQAVEWLGKAAEQGFARAQYNLGMMHYWGRGVGQNYTEAVKWFSKGAKQGFALAQTALGCLTQDLPQAVSRAPFEANLKDNQAVDWLRKAAIQGGLHAQVRLGLMYDEGRGVVQDSSRAAEYFRMATVNANDDGEGRGVFRTEAQYRLGRMYLDGRGVIQDNARAAGYLTLAAEKGLAEAQHELGWMYETSLAEGKCPDGKGDARAAEWYLKAARQGYSSSQNNLGILYLDGRGVEKDEAEGVAWLREAAEQGFPNAQTMLGRAYHFGRGVDQDYTQAVDWFRKAAVQGFASAQFDLSVAYYRGQGVNQDDAQAVEWALKAAEQGLDEAKVGLKEMHQEGRGGKWVKLYWEATQGANAAAQYKLSVLYDRRGDLALAVNWARRAAKQGHARAQNALARHYREGKGVEQNDAQSVRWYRTAAQQGLDVAQYHLAHMLDRGIGVAQNTTGALEWIGKAAKQGSVEAHLALGFMHQAGRDVGQDDVKGLKHYRKAARQGNTRAQFLLGLMYEVGRGVKQDRVQAVEWYRKAALRGFRDAQEKLAIMYHLGLGVEKNSTEAIQWYRLLIAQGSKWGQGNLDLLLNSMDPGAH